MEGFITVGIAGHVDHGKTTLVKCLTGVDTDRLMEEKTRGLSIESGVAPFRTSTGIHIALLDVPGHTDFMKNTIRGLCSVDAALLVVAADDGVMPQTLEHIEILEFMGAKKGIIVISKADLVDDETLELAGLEIRELLEGTFLQGSPLIPFSSVDLRGADEIRKCIKDLHGNIQVKNSSDNFRLWIDQIKSFSGFGTVVSGTILSGELAQGDPLSILPDGLNTRVRSLESHNQKIDRACAGQRVGVSLHKVPISRARRGMALTREGEMKPALLINVFLEVLARVRRPIKNRQRVKMHLGTSVINAMVVMMEHESLKPGDKGLVQLRLMRPVAAVPGDAFVISLMNVPTVIGGGNILEITDEKYRKAKIEKTLPYLKALRERDLKNFMDFLFKSGRNVLISSNELSKSTDFNKDEIEEEFKKKIKLRELVSFGNAGVLSVDAYKEMKQGITAIVKNALNLDPLKKALNPEEIRAIYHPPLHETPFQRMLAELCNEGKLVRVNGGVTTPDNSERLNAEQGYLIDICLRYSKETDMVPFSGDTVWKLHNKKFDKRKIEKILNYLHDQKSLIRLNDGRYLSPVAVNKIKERVARVISKKGEFTLGDLKEALGYGRSVGVPVLEHLDTMAFTRREGNRRVLMNPGGSCDTGKFD